MKKIICFSLLLTLVFSCTKPESISEQILGTWENSHMTVAMKTYQGTDENQELDARGEKWEQELKIKPIITTYRSDSTFTSEYFGLDGNPIGKEEGTWWVRNDSLILKSQGYDNAYHVRFTEDGMAHFVSYLDWDQDGEADDLYGSTQKRVVK